MRPTILVVEDEVPMQKYIRANLQARGYDVLGVGTGADALRVGGEQTFQAVILDIGLPDRDGLDILGALQHDAGLPVLVVSAGGRETDRQRALELGANGYLAKPFGVEQLLTRLEGLGVRSSATPRRIE
jgi:two-component system, OmpR family, KDP operon response regulator KdpE